MDTPRDTILFVDSDANIRRATERAITAAWKLKKGFHFGVLRPTSQVLYNLERTHERVLALITDLSFESSGERLSDEPAEHIGAQLAARAIELKVPNVAIYTGDPNNMYHDAHVEVLEKCTDQLQDFLHRIGVIENPPRAEAEAAKQ